MAKGRSEIVQELSGLRAGARAAEEALLGFNRALVDMDFSWLEERVLSHYLLSHGTVDAAVFNTLQGKFPGGPLESSADLSDFLDRRTPNRMIIEPTSQSSMPMSPLSRAIHGKDSIQEYLTTWGAYERS